MSLSRILATVGLSLGAAITAGIYAAPDAPDAALRADPGVAPGPATASLSAVPSLIPSGPARVEAMVGGADPAASSIATFTPDPLPAPAPAARREAEAPPRVTRDAPQTRTATDLRGTDAQPGDCSLSAQLTAQPAAMLSVVLHAPCDPGEPVAISHGALLLAEPVGADGRLALALPALRAEAGVTLAMLDGRTVQLSTTVPDFDLYQRVMVGWDGPAALELHAFAGGAGWNEPGHVRAGGPVSAATGFVKAFGDVELGGPQARVYTYPVGIAAGAGHVAVEAVLAVTPDTCGRPFVAEVTALLGPAATRQRQLEIEMPGCEGPAGFIAIPDLLPILTQPAVALLD